MRMKESYFKSCQKMVLQILFL